MPPPPTLHHHPPPYSIGYACYLSWHHGESCHLTKTFEMVPCICGITGATIMNII
ncbi:hypothetical protein HanIR_Chr08g0366721 [Helianthus annuus]|nr:hypothetical protein HanIR_Chr08g0366721 [Helianthus annuus]